MGIKSSRHYTKRQDQGGKPRAGQTNGRHLTSPTQEPSAAELPEAGGRRANAGCAGCKAPNRIWQGQTRSGSRRRMGATANRHAPGTNGHAVSDSSQETGLAKLYDVDRRVKEEVLPALWDVCVLSVLHAYILPLSIVSFPAKCHTCVKLVPGSWQCISVLQELVHGTEFLACVHCQARAAHAEVPLRPRERRSVGLPRQAVPGAAHHRRQPALQVWRPLLPSCCMHRLCTTPGSMLCNILSSDNSLRGKQPTPGSRILDRCAEDMLMLVAHASADGCARC